MPELELNIDAFKSEITENEGQVNRSSRLSSLLSPFKIQPKPLRDPIAPKEYDSTDYKIFLVLRDFLQPSSTVSSRDASERVLDAFADRNLYLRQLYAVCFELAEQIPYHHSSQLKLVRLMWVIGRSERHFKMTGQKDPTTIAGSFYQSLGEYIGDTQADPGDDDVDPVRYVNRQAFVSLLMEGGFWVPKAEDSLHVMRATFEENHEKETPAIRDAWVMGAAQWILWNGQSLLKLHFDPGDEAIPTGIQSKAELEEIMDSKRITLDTWHAWTTEFRRAAESDEFGEECKDVAKRASDLMEALENAMLK